MNILRMLLAAWLLAVGFSVHAQHDGGDSNQHGITVNLGPGGTYRDRETGLLYNGARYRDPKTNRFLTADPRGINQHVQQWKTNQGMLNRPPLELNPYIAVANNPLRWIDPTGKANVAPESGSGPFNQTYYPSGTGDVPTLPSIGQLAPIGKIAGTIMGVPATIGTIGATAPIAGDACLTAAQAAARSEAAKRACLALGICSATARGEDLDDIVRDFLRRQEISRSSEIAQQQTRTLIK